MAEFITIKRRVSLDAPIAPESLPGFTYMTEHQAHEFIISVRKNGEKETITGSVSANVIRPNGTTIFLQGSISDGDAVVRLHRDCYNIPGRLKISIFNTSGGVTTCIYSATYTNDRSTTDNVIDAGDVVPDISDVVAKQEEMTQVIADARTATTTANTAAQNVGSIVAHPYNPPYKAGEHCTQNGNLYKAKQAIPSDEEWTESHWTQTVMGDEVTDLKSALITHDYVFPLDGVDVSIKDGQSNALIVTVPRRLVLCRNGRNYTIDLSETQVVNVPHNNCLLIDRSNSLQVAPLSPTVLQNDNSILLYNNTGVASGPFSYAQRIENVINSERKTGSFINGLYINVQVSAKNAQNTIDVSVPPFIIVYDSTHTGTSVDLGSAQTYTLVHGELLIFDHNTNLIEKTTTGNALNARKNWTLLIYNNSGYAIGQWGYIQRISDVIDLEKRFCCEIVPIDVVGTVSQLQITPPTRNSFDVVVPRRVAIYSDNAVGEAVDFEQPTTYTLPHNGVLYFDHADNQIKIGATGITLNFKKNWTLLVLNNYGHAYGPWAKYQTDSVYSAPFVSTVLSSRQGDAGNFPENTLIGFKHSKLVGYSKVRGSCSFTSDGVGIMFHDRTLGTTGIVYDSDGNVVSDTTKNIEDYTYAELQHYDFGLYKGERFRGTEICTLEQFIRQAKQQGQDIDIELKYGLSEANMLAAYNLTIKYGMVYHTRWSNETLSNLAYIKSLNPMVSLGLIISKQNYLVDNAATLLSGENEVWCCLMGSELPFTDAFMQYIASKGLKTKIGSLRSGADMRTYCGFDELEIAVLEYPEWQILAT